MIGSAPRMIAVLVRAASFAAGFAAATALGTGASAADTAVPVPIVTIYPGDIVRDDMLRDKTYRLSAASQRALITERAELIGKVARRTLLAGRPIAPNSVKVPDLITPGQPVAIIYNAEGVVITGQAMPLEPGQAGALISLRNIDSGRVIKGFVQADGSVRVGAN